MPSMILLAAVSGLPAEPLGELDQFQLIGEMSVTAVHASRSAGQTFTVRRAGLLTAVELSLTINAPEGAELTLDILDASAGYVPTAILGTVALSGADLGPAPRDLAEDEVTGTLVPLQSFNIEVQPEDILGFRLSTDIELPDTGTAGWLRFSVAGADPYPDGEGFVNGTPGDVDFVFKMFVQPPPGIFEDGFEGL
ncbi:MAG: hypothetical protein AAGA23_18470 [Pseudomonadota bacterium]